MKTGWVNEAPNNEISTLVLDNSRNDLIYTRVGCEEFENLVVVLAIIFG